MTLHRRLSLFVAIGGLSLVPASAFIRNATSSGAPLTRSDSSGIQVLVNSSMQAGETNSSGTAVITAFSNPMQAVTAAAAQWSAVVTALVTFAAPQPTTATNNPSDGQYVVTIQDTPANRSQVGSALAVTLYSFNGSGVITDSDIIFNPTGGSNYIFSTDQTPNTTDLQSVLVHEMGHSLGANHSPVLSATMFQSQPSCQTGFPTANCILHQKLSPDDVAFATNAYPAAAASQLGSIVGTVSFTTSAAVVGALVVAVNSSQGTIIGGLSNLQTGAYRLDDLPLGNYVVYAQPLNGPVQTGNLSGIPNIGSANTSFRTTFAGGNASPSTLAVTAGSTTTANISVDPTAPVLHVAIMGTGNAGGFGDFSYNGGAQAKPSGPSGTTDLLLWGPGLDNTITANQILLLGPGLTLRPTTVHVDTTPDMQVNGLFPLRFTVDIATALGTAAASVAVVKGTDAAVYSGGLVILPLAGGSCTYAVSTQTFNESASAAQETVNVTAPVGCAWTATTTTSWLHVLSGASGSANGTVTFSVDANTTNFSRIGNLTVAGVTVTVNQPVSAGPPPPTSGLGFYPVTPCRVADTRNAPGVFGAPSMTGGQTRDFPIPTSACGIPITAKAYSLNFTVVPSGPLGYLSTWPTGQAQPVVSTLNAQDGAITANAAIVPAGTAGSISVFVSSNTDVIIDVNGYFATADANALAFYPVTPCRVADTRTAAGSFGGPALSAGQTRSFAVPSGPCAVPASAQAYSLNMTAVPPARLTYLSTWPAGKSQPVVSTLNALDGRIVANAAIVPAGTGGAINVYTSDASNVLIDINGYFGPPGGAGALYFYTATPCRIADTRGAAGSFGGPSLVAGVTRSFPIPASSCGVSALAQAYSLNMTVVPPGTFTFLSTWPAGQSQPVVSTLNALDGRVAANAAIVPAGTSGAINVYGSNPTDLIIDVNGYFAP